MCPSMFIEKERERREMSRERTKLSEGERDGQEAEKGPARRRRNQKKLAALKLSSLFASLPPSLLLPSLTILAPSFDIWQPQRGRERVGNHEISGEV